MRPRLLVLAVLPIALAGCVGRALPPGELGVGHEVRRLPVPVPAEESAEASGTLLVLGRSVMTGWMAHWGGDAATPVTREGWAISFREVSGPPDIADSAAAAIAEAPPGSTVLFKLCFVDFAEDGSVTAADEGYVRDVAAAARSRGVRLLVGNALPQVASASTPALVGQHRAYDAWLESNAAAEGFEVLDLNGVLAGSDGVLRAAYAASPDDSHLSEPAYDALDAVLFPMLAKGAVE